MQPLVVGKRRIPTSVSFTQEILNRIEPLRENLSRSAFINQILDEHMTKMEKQQNK